MIAAVDDPDSLVEVVIAWGESVLHVAHLRSAHAAFSIGERGTFAMPSERIGHARLELVRGRTAFVPTEARGQVCFGDEAMSLAEARGCGRIDQGRLPLARGVRTRFELGGFTVQIALVGRAEKMAGKGPQRRLLPWVVAVLLHVGTLSSLAQSPGAGSDADVEALAQVDDATTARQTFWPTPAAPADLAAPGAATEAASEPAPTAPSIPTPSLVCEPSPRDGLAAAIERCVDAALRVGRAGALPRCP